MVYLHENREEFTNAVNLASEYFHILPITLKQLLRATEHAKTSSLSVYWKLPVAMKQMLNMMHRRKARIL